ncbi:gliding motility-associated C-terminal domain-containing protein [Maribacter halichondriae]|uniref:gliding motility-associated C-terminal domain-containing protein n=1 Tax=Maribacter halichondriae TaxID=2980554 RepID=UPI00235907DF|nr:gliding motility-associated C-terminal domain-containing protein [Maribacter sp. Hal144]
MEFVSVTPLPSEITYNFDTNTRELTFMVADGYTDVTSAPYTIQYALRVQNDSYFAGLPACTFDSNSQTMASFSGEISMNPQTSYSSFTFDNCGVGNGDPTIITISITDVQAPTFDGTLPADITVECDSVPDAAVLTATDYCDMNPVVTFNETATNNRDCVTGYEITRTWTATDNANNSFTHTQIITVNGNLCLMDEEAPVFVEELPMDMTVDCDSIPEAEVLTAIDNCDMDPVVTFEETATNDRDCEMGYEIMRTWTATDNVGNQMTHTQIITVEADMPCNVEDLVVSKTITANGDGINDLFEITGLEACNYTYHVKIFNRWGNIVYESNDYSNDWGGIAPDNSLGNSGMLPSGTYYYIIGFGNPEMKPVNGYIYIGSNI